MHRNRHILASIAFATAFGASSIAVFAGQFADHVSTTDRNVILYTTPDVGALLGFQKNMYEPAIDVDKISLDPRLMSTAAAYAVIDMNTAREMIGDMKDDMGRANEGTSFDGYGLIMIGSETLQHYAVMLDEVVELESVMVLVIGNDAAGTLMSVGIDRDDIFVGKPASRILDMFAAQTLGLGDQKVVTTNTDLGAAAPEMVESQG